MEERIDSMMLVFGSGGKLLQAHDRDEQKFAIKATHVIIDEESVNIEKDPITDSGKKSKKGYLKLVRKQISDVPGEEWKNFVTLQSGDPGFDEAVDVLVPVFLNGEILKDYNFEELRTNAALTQILETVEA
jgi:nicotinamide phosphoribosyltransferase